MLYFLLHDGETFHRRIAPAFAASWRRRTFGPVAGLAADFSAVLADFADRFRLTADERPLLSSVTAATPFDRRLWRHLAGEVLLYAAADAPAIQTAQATLEALATPAQMDAIRQAHAGNRDLDFDGVPYRPSHAGLNDTDDVARLADQLAVIDPARWTESALTELADDERAEELAFARECFAALLELYEHARGRRQVVVCEDI
jgi:hypothetical protein